MVSINIGKVVEGRFFTCFSTSRTSTSTPLVLHAGPQFSSLAESNLYRSWGADVIGMTNMPEAKLAREAEIRYATIAMVTDFDCWHPDHEDVSVEQVVKTLLGNAEKAKKVVAELLLSFEADIDEKDPANKCLDVAIITDKKAWTKETLNNLSTIAGRVLNK